MLGYTRGVGESSLVSKQHAINPMAVLFKPITRVGLFETLLTLQDGEVQNLNQMIYQDESSDRMNQGAILVAEDHEINQIVIRALLQQLDFEVKVVKNGEEVLSELHVQPWKLILMDLFMPEMDGLEAVKHIRQMRQYDHLPVVAITANSMKKIIRSIYRQV